MGRWSTGERERKREASVREREGEKEIRQTIEKEWRGKIGEKRVIYVNKRQRGDERVRDM